MDSTALFRQTVMLYGIVEGVGMRPALYRMAVRLGLTGFVRNCSKRVELCWEGSAAQLAQARMELSGQLPAGSRLDRIEFGGGEPLAPELRHCDFSIQLAAKEAGKVNLLTPPDLAPCAECRSELHESGNRRHGFAFNSCSCCGPRATVITSLPYEREATAWREFPLCPECRKEYGDFADRRFHIEGISCPACGPQVRLLSASGAEVAAGEAAFDAAGALLRTGKILALKGVGGFLLLADPRRIAALKRLRESKFRPEKPLALLAVGMDVAGECFEIPKAAREALTSPAAPIVLLSWRPEASEKYHPDLIAPDRPEEAGVMLPASPLHLLLMEAFGGPFLVATSGNGAEAPPALNEEEALRGLHGVADAFLTHNRAILWRHDDSVGAVNAGTFQLWRRARGYGWGIHGAEPFECARPVLAVGGGLKNTFAAAGNGWMLLSPHHGDLEECAAAEEWEGALDRTLAQLAETPEVVAADLHCDYYSSIAAQKLARERNLPLVRVPHHYAHALAGLYESGLPEALALVFDGTGIGPDGALWGAELLYVSREKGGRRLATFAPAPLPGGAAAIRRCHRQYLGRLWQAGVPPESEAAEWIYKQCDAKVNAPESHSAGRLFDAFAAHLGVAPEEISYEGQSAIRLEAAAWREPTGAIRLFPWSSGVANGVMMINWDELWRDDLSAHASPARDFHISVAHAAIAMLGQAERLPVILTGGVMQNRFLTGILAELLRERGQDFFIPSRIPPNDGGIAVGQICYCAWNFRLSGKV